MKLNPLFHVIKDPVHGTMQFNHFENACVKPFIDSPHFQRLRHIKQLGLGDYIFPGAVHTRFNHSLGCSYVSSQITQKIGLADEERQMVMIACLLHDIGHGPFSHAFEGLFTKNAIRHEDWTPYFLADYRKEPFFETYNKNNPEHHLTAKKFNLIEQMIMHQSAKKNLLADIVSSQLDADRLDYLLRDSHFCGVSYGQFDFRWMLHCMAIVENKGCKRLGITHKGIGVVEHYLMARRLMARNIYHGQKKLALETLLIELLAQLASSLDDTVPLSEIKKSRIGQFLLAANLFNNETNVDLLKQKKQFLQTNFQYYKLLCDYDVVTLIQSLAHLNINHAAVDIAKRLSARIMPKIVRIDDNNLIEATDLITQFKNKNRKNYADWQLKLIQTPHQSYSGEEDPILVVNEWGQVKPLSDFSLMINAIADKLERIAFLSIDKTIAEEAAVIALIKQLQVRS